MHRGTAKYCSSGHKCWMLRCIHVVSGIQVPPRQSQSYND